MKTTCVQCKYFETHSCKDAKENDGACAAFEPKKEEEDK